MSTIQIATRLSGPKTLLLSLMVFSVSDVHLIADRCIGPARHGTGVLEDSQ